MSLNEISFQRSEISIPRNEISFRRGEISSFKLTTEYRCNHNLIAKVCVSAIMHLMRVVYEKKIATIATIVVERI